MITFWREFSSRWSTQPTRKGQELSLFYRLGASMTWQSFPTRILSVTFYNIVWDHVSYFQRLTKTATQTSGMKLVICIISMYIQHYFCSSYHRPCFSCWYCTRPPWFASAHVRKTSESLWSSAFAETRSCQVSAVRWGIYSTDPSFWSPFLSPGSTIWSAPGTLGYDHLSERSRQTLWFPVSVCERKGQILSSSKNIQRRRGSGPCLLEFHSSPACTHIFAHWVTGGARPRASLVHLHDRRVLIV